MSAQYCPGQGGMKHLYGKNRPAQAGIPARRDGTKNVLPPYKQYAIKTIETYTCLDPGHRLLAKVWTLRFGFNLHSRG